MIHFFLKKSFYKNQIYLLLIFMVYLCSNCSNNSQKSIDEQQRKLDSLSFVEEDRENKEIRRDVTKEVIDYDTLLVDSLKLDSLKTR